MLGASKLWWLLMLEGFAWGFAVVLAADLVPAWGQWYSRSIYHRQQVEALLAGSLALSSDPSLLEHDLVWSQGGVHQVWGLGVALWRLPFEALARVVGLEAFPDMVAFAIALGLSSWAVVAQLSGSLDILRVSLREHVPRWSRDRLTKSIVWRAVTRYGGQWSSVALARLALLGGAALVLLAFPPFVGLLHSRFDVYEEVIAYEYVLGLGLTAGLLAVAQRPSTRAYTLLCIVAGFGGFIRPTLFLHGIAALLAGAFALWLGKWEYSARCLTKAPLSHRRKQPTRAIAGCSEVGTRDMGTHWWTALPLGIGVFVMLGGLLFATNRARFGGGFEFGHKLNVQHPYGSLYATRFDHPYTREPLIPAGRELFGWLFLSRVRNGAGFYQSDIVHGQSPTLRWRESYLRTYDLSYVTWFAGALLGGLLMMRERAGRQTERDGAREQDCGPGVVATMMLYGTLSSVLLLTFYLRSPVISSRYVLDLMPSFAAVMAAGWMAWGWLWIKRGRGLWGVPVLLVLLCVWVVSELGSVGTFRDSARVLTWRQVAERRHVDVGPAELPASGVYVSPEDAANTGIPYNGAGWDAPSGMVMPCVIVFVDDPEFIEVEVIPLSQEARRNGPVALRAKIGLEYLSRESMKPSKKGWVVRFAGPRSQRYKTGLQVVFLATVPNTCIGEPRTSWRLLRLRWRDTTKEA